MTITRAIKNLEEAGLTSQPKSDWNPAKHTIPPRKELCIDYDPEADILTLWTGTPASNGSGIAQDLMVFFDEEDEPQMVTLEGAAKLLRPYLFPEA